MTSLSRKILFCTFLLSSVACIYGACDEIKPDIHAKSAITIDVGTREIIFAKDIDSIRFPASTTKIVTAIMLALYKQKDEILYYSDDAKHEEPYRLNLNSGDRMSAEMAMDALLLFSGNDIAHMIAENISATIPDFATLMNSYIKDLGLKDTHFTNPTGLHDPNHYTTAYELSVIAREMYEYPWIMESSAREYRLISAESGFKVEIQNKNKNLGKNGCVAGKTGWTPEAGRCLLALYERDGRRIAGIVMDSLYLPGDTAAFEDMDSIIGFSYEAQKKTIVQSGLLGKEAIVKFKTLIFFGPEAEIKIPLCTKTNIDCYPSGDSLHDFFQIEEIDPWNLNKDRSIGELGLREKEVTHTAKIYPLLSTFDLIAMNAWFYFFCALVFCFTVFLVALILYLKTNSKRKRVKP